MTTPKKVEIPPPKLQFFDENGDPLVGGLVFTYRAGTTEKIVTYTDADRPRCPWRVLGLGAA